MNTSPAILLIGIGLLLVAAGLLALTGAFDWFGRLPGDIRIEGENSRIFIPITSMIVVSVVLSILVNLLWRLFH